MSLTKCPECSKEISNKAETCPHCGFKLAQAASGILKSLAKLVRVILIFFVILFGLAVFHTCSVMQQTATLRSNKAEDNTPAVAVTPTKPTWIYLDFTDDMTGKSGRQATIESSNTVALSPPYSATTSAQLMIRRHPRHGNDVIVKVDSGQTLCRSYEDCTLLVRFDDAPPRQYSGIGPDDNSSDTVFLRNYASFVANLRKSKRVLIQIPMYEAGGSAWRFDVDGYKPEASATLPTKALHRNSTPAIEPTSEERGTPPE